MPYTETDLATAVLREMGVNDALETPATEDLAYVQTAYQQKFAELAAPGLEYTYWPIGTIPDAIFLVLRDLVINETRGAFGDPVSVADKDAQETIILKRLRRHVSVKPSGLPSRAEYF